MRKKVDPFMTDEDNPPLDAEFWRKARPAREVMPPAFLTGMKKLAVKRRTELRRAGRPPIGDKPKVSVSLRLDADVVAGIRASGRGYNARIEKVLRAALAKGRL